MFDLLVLTSSGDNVDKVDVKITGNPYQMGGLRMLHLLVLPSSQDTRWMYELSGNPYHRGGLCMLDLLVLTSLEDTINTINV
jgi:hypothetical protein